MRLALVLMVLAAAVVGGLAGAVVGYGAGKLRPAKYVGTAYVRAPVADSTCVFFSCPTVSPGPSGIPYVATQALYITTPPLNAKIAAVIHKKKLMKNPPSISVLTANVKAAEVGSSTSIVLTYTAPTAAEAQQAAAAYAGAYLTWANGRAARSLLNLHQSLLKEMAQAHVAHNPQLGAAIRKDIDEVAAARAGLKALPNAATDFGLTPSEVVVKRSGLVTVKSAGIGAFVGSILGVVVLLVFLSRSPDRKLPEEPEESQDVLEAERREPVHRH
jgi:hypothetical protein